MNSRLAGRPVTPRTNLPAALSSFIGRDDDAAEVSRLLSTVRLLTLTGAGGVGKTRLALHVAAQLTTIYPGGVWLVDLAPLAEPMLVPQAVASVVGVREQPGIALADTLAAALRETQVLLVLDNCEHLIEACAALVHRLLEACSCLRVLTTSREALGVPGETAWQVLPLPVPSSPTQATFDGLQANWAVRLFVERARSVAPDFDLSPLNAVTIGDVCNRLDGLPLAIELAAARVKVLAPAQIAARLDDRLNLLVAGSRTAPHRQRTLRAALDWSYHLLTASEQLLFARLAVFSGGWTLESAEAVAGTEGITPAEVLDLLAALVAKSLVVTEAGVTGTVRYRFLESVRQYALDHLAEKRDTELVRNRHATYFLTAVEAAASILFGTRDQRYEACLNQLQLEQDNLRAALRWLIAQGQTDEAQRLGGALRYFWFFQGHVSEGRAWLAQLASLPGSSSPTAGRASVLAGAAMLAFQQGDHETTRSMAQEAESLWRHLGKDVERGLALFNLGSVAGISGKRLEARAWHEEALGLGRVAGERTVAARTVKALNLYGLSELAFGEGDYPRARARAEEALAAGRELGLASPRNSSFIGMLGNISLEEGDLTAARVSFEDSLAEARNVGWDWGVGQALVRVAHVAIEQGDLERAAEVLAEAFHAYRDQGNRTGVIVCLEAFAYLEAKRGRVSAALRLAGAAATLRETTNTPAGTTERRRLERWLGSAKRALGEHASELVLAQARVAPTEQVIAEALTVLDARADSRALPERRTTSRHGAAAPLTDREQQVVVVLAQGLTNLQIAEALGLSERTVESHVRNALSKLDLTSRVSLARWAVEQQLRSPRPAP